MNRVDWWSRIAVTTFSLAGSLMFLGTAATAADQGSDGISVSSLEEVVVTAERRETNLQRTAVSIVALDAVALEAKGISDVRALAQNVPGLSSVSDAENIRPTFMIRGIGNSSGRETQETGVALYVDDIYLPRSNGTYLQLVDVERVEVLRGPQGTLFGRNSPGGAVRYIARKPGNEFEARATASIGSANLLNVTGLINVPFTDRVAGRFQFGSFNQDGYIKLTQSNQLGGGTRDLVSRGVFRFSVTDDLTIDVGTSHVKSTRDRAPTVVLTNNITDPMTSALSGRLTQLGQPALTVNDPRFIFSDRYTSSGACYLGNNTLASSANGRNIFNDQLNYCRDGLTQTTNVSFLDIGWNLPGNLSLRALSGYVDGTTASVGDGSGAGAARWSDTANYNSFSQEVQLKFDGERINVVGGLFYFRESPIRQQYNAQLASTPGVQFGQCCQGNKTDTTAETISKGAFAQASVELTEKLEATVGARYSKDDKEISVRRSDRPTAAPGTLFRNTGDWSHVDYRASLQYQFTEELMTYGTVSTGYKAGGFNDSPAVSNIASGGIYAYNPEKVTNYEVGMKSQWFANRLRFNITAFRMNYVDQQLTAPYLDTSITPAATVLVTQNAGRTRLTGLETELAWRIVEGLTLEASVSTLNQKALFLPNSSGLLITSTCQTPSAPTFATCQSNPIAGAPKYQYTVGPLYQVSLPGATLDMSATYSYSAEKQASNSATASLLLPGYGLLSARAEYAPNSSHWSIAVFGTNITNKYYLLSGQNGAGFFGNTVGVVGRPATFGVEMKAHF